jgi:hypothetical protein
MDQGFGRFIRDQGADGTAPDGFARLESGVPEPGHHEGTINA